MKQQINQIIVKLKWIDVNNGENDSEGKVISAPSTGAPERWSSTSTRCQDWSKESAQQHHSTSNSEIEATTSSDAPSSQSFIQQQQQQQLQQQQQQQQQQQKWWNRKPEVVSK